MAKRFWSTFLLAACLVAPSAGVFQELTWVMDEQKMSYLPFFAGEDSQYKYKKVYAGPVNGIPGTFLAYNSYFTGEHMGTHVDAPYHVFESGRTMDKVTLDDLIGPLVKVDIVERAAGDRDTMVTVEDLNQWESRNGPIPERSFVLMFTGWDRYYGDNIQYVGTNKSVGEGGALEMTFPGFSGDAAKWLVENRNIRGIGVDVASCDAGKTTDGAAHHWTLANDRLCLENLRDLAKVPECGARLNALPIMLKGGTGTQARVFAEWYPGVGYETTCNGALRRMDDVFIQNSSGMAAASVSIVLSVFLLSLL